MDISSVGRSSSYQSIQKMPEAAVPKIAPVKDGDADDRQSSAASAQSVNTSGQTLGRLINVVA